MLGSSTAPDDKPATEKPVFELPEGYATEADLLTEMRQFFYDDIQYDRLNREAALEDLRFVVGDQWDDIVRQRREAARKPVLTVNRLPAFLAQLLGQRRQSETNIEVLADNGGTTSMAFVREGLIRQIQDVSRANTAYNKALEGSAACGIGNFQVEMDYDPQDVWNQAIKISAINDHLAVVWDRMLTEPTGADAGHVFVVDVLTKKEFEKKWPWATAADIVIDVTLRGDLRMNGWISVDDVRIVSYWRMRERKRTYALMQDGSTQDITDKVDEGAEGYDAAEAHATLSSIAQRKDGTPIMREVMQKYAQMYLCSGLDILEGPYDLPISRVPVLRVPGWEINVGEWKHRWGLVRFLKDPQRLHNYWRSVWAEKIMQTPRNVWMAADTAVQGREKDFRNSHLSDDPLLIYNAESGQKPERVPPAQMENALGLQAEMTTQDIKDVSNIHEANLGMPSNEVSGAAIMARQRVSDTGTAIYHDNLNDAIEEAGIIINQLIPICYDTPRIIKVLGKDAKQHMIAINSTKDNDITAGMYSIKSATGPSTETKRIEAAEGMMTFINAAPSVAGIVMDLVAESMDWPMHDEFARRIRMTLPPGMVDPSDMSPQELQRAQTVSQQQAQQQAFQLHMALAKYLQTQSEATLNNARAENYTQTAAAVAPRTQNESMTAASQATERQLSGSLEAIRVASGA